MYHSKAWRIIIAQKMYYYDMHLGYILNMHYNPETEGNSQNCIFRCKRKPYQYITISVGIRSIRVVKAQPCKALCLNMWALKCTVALSVYISSDLHDEEGYFQFKF